MGDAVLLGGKLVGFMDVGASLLGAPLIGGAAVAVTVGKTVGVRVGCGDTVGLIG